MHSSSKGRELRSEGVSATLRNTIALVFPTIRPSLSHRIPMSKTLIIEFEKISLRRPLTMKWNRFRLDRDEVLLARYSFQATSTAPNSRVAKKFRLRTALSWFESAKAHPDCFVDVSDSMSQNIDVWIRPFKAGSKPTPLRLEMYECWNRIQANVTQSDYDAYLAMLADGEVTSAKIRQRITLTFGRESPAKRKFGFILPIVSICAESVAIGDAVTSLTESAVEPWMKLRSIVSAPSKSGGKWAASPERIALFLKTLEG